MAAYSPNRVFLHFHRRPSSGPPVDALQPDVTSASGFFGGFGLGNIVLYG